MQKATRIRKKRPKGSEGRTGRPGQLGKQPMDVNTVPLRVKLVLYDCVKQYACQVVDHVHTYIRSIYATFFQAVVGLQRLS